MDHGIQFFSTSADIPPTLSEILQNDRATFEFQFNTHADGYIRKMLIKYPDLLEELIKKAIVKGFIDIIDGTSKFCIYNSDESVVYTFVEYNEKIRLMLHSNGDIESRLISNLINLESFTHFIIEKLKEGYSIKFISKDIE